MQSHRSNGNTEKRSPSESAAFCPNQLHGSTTTNNNSINDKSSLNDSSALRSPDTNSSNQYGYWHLYSPQVQTRASTPEPQRYSMRSLNSHSKQNNNNSNSGSGNNVCGHWPNSGCNSGRYRVRGSAGRYSMPMPECRSAAPERLSTNSLASTSSARGSGMPFGVWGRPTLVPQHLQPYYSGQQQEQPQQQQYQEMEPGNYDAGDREALPDGPQGLDGDEGSIRVFDAEAIRGSTCIYHDPSAPQQQQPPMPGGLVTLLTMEEESTSAMMTQPQPHDCPTDEGYLAALEQAPRKSYARVSGDGDGQDGDSTCRAEASGINSGIGNAAAAERFSGQTHSGGGEAPASAGSTDASAVFMQHRSHLYPTQQQQQCLPTETTTAYTNPSYVDSNREYRYQSHDAQMTSAQHWDGNGISAQQQQQQQQQAGLHNESGAHLDDGSAVWQTSELMQPIKDVRTEEAEVISGFAEMQVRGPGSTPTPQKRLFFDETTDDGDLSRQNEYSNGAEGKGVAAPYHANGLTASSEIGVAHPSQALFESSCYPLCYGENSTGWGSAFCASSADGGGLAGGGVGSDGGGRPSGPLAIESTPPPPARLASASLLSNGDARPAGGLAAMARAQAAPVRQAPPRSGHLLLRYRKRCLEEMQLEERTLTSTRPAGRSMMLSGGVDNSGAPALDPSRESEEAGMDETNDELWGGDTKRPRMESCNVQRTIALPDNGAGANGPPSNNQPDHLPNMMLSLRSLSPNVPHNTIATPKTARTKRRPQMVTDGSATGNYSADDGNEETC